MRRSLKPVGDRRADAVGGDGDDGDASVGARVGAVEGGEEVGGGFGEVAGGGQGLVARDRAEADQVFVG